VNRGQVRFPRAEALGCSVFALRAMQNCPNFIGPINPIGPTEIYAGAGSSVNAEPGTRNALAPLDFECNNLAFPDLQRDFKLRGTESVEH
jgi:hypothetical protein